MSDGDVYILQVPSFIAEEWSKASGRCVGVLSPNNELYLSSGMPLSKLDRAVHKASPSELVMKVGSDENGTFTRPAISNGVKASVSFRPNMLSPEYREWLIKKQESQVNAGPALATPLVCDQTRFEAGDAGRLFRYFQADGESQSASTASSTPSRGTPKPSFNLREAQTKLFSLLELRGMEGATLKEVQQTLYPLPHATMKSLLDQVAEPQRERLGRTSTFVLKPQFRSQ